MATDESRLLVRLEATATKLVKELQRGESETRRRMKGIDDAVTASNRRVTEGMARSAASYREGAKGADTYRFAVQNAAFQVGDFAVQVAGGANATRALAQQLPQLLGGLGLFGALAGAAAAIVLPLAGNFLAAGEEMKKIDAISLDGVRSRIIELTDLQTQYREAVRINAFAQTEASAQAVTALGTEYQAKLALFQLELRTVEQRKRQLEESIKSQREAIDELFNGTIAVNAARVLEDQALAEFTLTESQQLRLEATRDIVAQNEALFLEIRKQQAELDLVNLQLSESQGLLGGAVGVADALTGSLGNAAGAAGALATNLSAAGREYGKIQNRGDSGPDAARRETLGLNAPGVIKGTVGSGAAGVFKPVTSGSSGSKGGGGGGGASRSPTDFLDQRLAAAQAAAEAAKIEAQSILLGAEAATKEKVKLDLLNEAKRQKLNLDQKSVKTGLTLRQQIDQQAEAIAKLTRETEIYRERAQFMDQQNEALKDGFLDAIVEGKNFGEVLQNVARQLARAALEAAIFNTGPFASTGGGGGFGSGLGGLFKGLVGGLFGGFLAEGGPVTPGKAYVVGEKGPEIFTPGRAGAIIPNGGGAGAAASRLVVTLSPDLEARILDKSAHQSVVIAGQSQRQQTRAFGTTSRTLQARGTV
jgi:hypothetical protein